MNTYSVKHSVLITALFFGLVILPSSLVFAGTDFRVGAAVPISKIVFSEADVYNVGLGFEALFDFQTSRDASTYISLGYFGASGKAQNSSLNGEIISTPSLSDYLLSMGYSYYVFRRKSGVTPVFTAEAGFHFVTEDIVSKDIVVGTSTPSTNHILFQSVGLALGVEIPVDDRLTLDPRIRLNLNFPITSPTNYSYVYGNNGANYIQAQFVVAAEYRLGH